MSTDFAEKYGLDRIAGGNGHPSCPDAVTRLDRDIETVDRLPCEDGYFDVVAMLAVFEHIERERLVRLVADIGRVLRPGGLYIPTTPAAWADGLLQIMAKLRVVNPVLFAEHKDAYTPAKIARILQRGGFSTEELRFGYFEMFMNTWATAMKT